LKKKLRKKFCKRCRKGWQLSSLGATICKPGNGPQGESRINCQHSSKLAAQTDSQKEASITTKKDFYYGFQMAEANSMIEPLGKGKPMGDHPVDTLRKLTDFARGGPHN